MSRGSGAGPARQGRAAAWLAITLAWSGAAPASARLVDAILAFDGSDAYVLPQKLSQTGLYADILAKPRQVTAGITAFEVNSPLWSDGAIKERFITVPQGKTVIPTDTSRYTFPDKSVMVKNFMVDTVVGDSNSRILIETRFQVFHVDSSGTGHWYGISYAWQRDQADANLVSPGDGSNQVINLRAGAQIVGKRWRYPSRGECRKCHIGGREALGFITPQLNRPARGTPGTNQLQSLVSAGVLASNPLTASPGAMKWAALSDTSASLELRARSYLASNCSHCHGNGQKPGGGITHNFDFLNKNMKFMADSSDPRADGPYVGKPASSMEFPFLLYPGHSDSSDIMHRMLERMTFEEPNFYQMPPLATYQPDSAALKVLADWVCVLGGRKSGSCSLPTIEVPGWASPTRIRAGRNRPQDGFSLRREGGGWRLELDGSAASAKTIRLTDPTGRVIAFRPDGHGVFFAPRGLIPGIYLLRIGARTRKILIE